MDHDTSYSSTEILIEDDVDFLALKVQALLEEPDKWPKHFFDNKHENVSLSDKFNTDKNYKHNDKQEYTAFINCSNKSPNEISKITKSNSKNLKKHSNNIQVSELHLRNDQTKHIISKSCINVSKSPSSVQDFNYSREPYLRFKSNSFHLKKNKILQSEPISKFCPKTDSIANQNDQSVQCNSTDFTLQDIRSDLVSPEQNLNYKSFVRPLLDASLRNEEDLFSDRSDLVSPEQNLNYESFVRPLLDASLRNTEDLFSATESSGKEDSSTEILIEDDVDFLALKVQALLEEPDQWPKIFFDNKHENLSLSDKFKTDQNYKHNDKQEYTAFINRSNKSPNEISKITKSNSKNLKKYSNNIQVPELHLRNDQTKQIISKSRINVSKSPSSVQDFNYSREPYLTYKSNSFQLKKNKNFQSEPISRLCPEMDSIANQNDQSVQCNSTDFALRDIRNDLVSPEQNLNYESFIRPLLDASLRNKENLFSDRSDLVSPEQNLNYESFIRPLLKASLRNKEDLFSDTESSGKEAECNSSEIFVTPESIAIPENFSNEYTFFDSEISTIQLNSAIKHFPCKNTGSESSPVVKVTNYSDILCSIMNADHVKLLDKSMSKYSKSETTSPEFLVSKKETELLNSKKFGLMSEEQLQLSASNIISKKQLHLKNDADINCKVSDDEYKCDQARLQHKLVSHKPEGLSLINKSMRSYYMESANNMLQISEAPTIQEMDKVSDISMKFRSTRFQLDGSNTSSSNKSGDDEKLSSCSDMILDKSLLSHTDFDKDQFTNDKFEYAESPVIIPINDINCKVSDDEYKCDQARLQHKLVSHKPEGLSLINKSMRSYYMESANNMLQISEAPTIQEMDKVSDISMKFRSTRFQLDGSNTSSSNKSGDDEKLSRCSDMILDKSLLSHTDFDKDQFTNDKFEYAEPPLIIPINDINCKVSDDEYKCDQARLQHKLVSHKPEGLSLINKSMRSYYMESANNMLQISEAPTIQEMDKVSDISMKFRSTRFQLDGSNTSSSNKSGDDEKLSSCSDMILDKSLLSHTDFDKDQFTNDKFEYVEPPVIIPINDENSLINNNLIKPSKIIPSSNTSPIFCHGIAPIIADSNFSDNDYRNQVADVLENYLFPTPLQLRNQNTSELKGNGYKIFAEQLISSDIEMEPGIRWYPVEMRKKYQGSKNVSTQTTDSFIVKQVKVNFSDAHICSTKKSTFGKTKDISVNKLECLPVSTSFNHRLPFDEQYSFLYSTIKPDSSLNDTGLQFTTEKSPIRKFKRSDSCPVLENDLFSTPHQFRNRNTSELKENGYKIFAEQLISSDIEMEPHIRWYPVEMRNKYQDIKNVSTQTTDSFIVKQVKVHFSDAISDTHICSTKKATFGNTKDIGVNKLECLPVSNSFNHRLPFDEQYSFLYSTIKPDSSLNDTGLQFTTEKSPIRKFKPSESCPNCISSDINLENNSIEHELKVPELCKKYISEQLFDHVNKKTEDETTSNNIFLAAKKISSIDQSKDRKISSQISEQSTIALYQDSMSSQHQVLLELTENGIYNKDGDKQCFDDRKQHSSYVNCKSGKTNLAYPLYSSKDENKDFQNSKSVKFSKPQHTENDEIFVSLDQPKNVNIYQKKKSKLDENIQLANYKEILKKKVDSWFSESKHSISFCNFSSGCYCMAMDEHHLQRAFANYQSRIKINKMIKTLQVKSKNKGPKYVPEKTSIKINGNNKENLIQNKIVSSFQENKLSSSTKHKNSNKTLGNHYFNAKYNRLIGKIYAEYKQRKRRTCGNFQTCGSSCLKNKTINGKVNFKRHENVF